MTTVHYLWDSIEDNIVRELDDAGVVIADYTTEPDLFGNVISHRRGGESRFFHHDGLGSTVAVTDESASVTDTRAYAAFGETTAASGGTVFPFQYVGQKGYYTDSVTGELLVRRRAYLPQSGRWMSLDPIIFATNEYVFARLNPITFRDPSGLQAIEPDEDRCSCEDFVAKLASPITVKPDPFFTKPRFSACTVVVECKDDCGPAPASTSEPDKGGIIKICLTNKARHRTTLDIIYKHELEHASQLCGSQEDVLASCQGCVRFEKKVTVHTFPTDLGDIAVGRLA